VIPAEDTKIIIEDELAGAYAWADRHKMDLLWRADDLELRVELTQPETAEVFFLQGLFDGYKALPPAWSFCDDNFVSAAVASQYPMPTQSPFGSSIFIMHQATPTICAPFNRLAYAKHQGPHNDWGEPTRWLNAGENYVKAHSLGDMLQAIYRDFVLSRGRMT
jgi:hypothetical protein